jgi:hypothetical protein
MEHKDTNSISIHLRNILVIININSLTNPLKGRLNHAIKLKQNLRCLLIYLYNKLNLIYGK